MKLWSCYTNLIQTQNTPFFTLQLIFGFLLKIVSCDKHLILKEHHTYCWRQRLMHIDRHSPSHPAQAVTTKQPGGDFIRVMTLQVCLWDDGHLYIVV